MDSKISFEQAVDQVRAWTELLKAKYGITYDDDVVLYRKRTLEYYNLAVTHKRAAAAANFRVDVHACMLAIEREECAKLRARVKRLEMPPPPPPIARRKRRCRKDATADEFDGPPMSARDDFTYMRNMEALLKKPRKNVK